MQEQTPDYKPKARQKTESGMLARLTDSIDITSCMKYIFIIATLLLTQFLTGCTTKRAAPGDSFSYLTYDNDVLQSTHDIRFSLKIPEGYRPIAPLNHKATFNEHPFNVSVVGFIGNNRVIAVHAERVTDDYGFLDYSYLEPVRLSGIDFYMKAQCLELPEGVVEDTADLRYFKENGFNFYPNVYLKQFFYNSLDGNSEYILSYGARVADCAENTITDSFKSDIDKEIEGTIRLVKID